MAKIKENAAKSNRGGKREGAGRKDQAKKTKRASFKFDKEIEEILNSLPPRTANEFVATAIKHYYKYINSKNNQ